MIYTIKLFTKMEDDEGYYSEQLAESDSCKTIMELWNDFQYWDFDKDDDCLALFKGEENLEEYYLTEKQKLSKANVNPTFAVHYSSDEHDSLLAENLSLFEATCEYYEMIDDLEDDEWITIIDEDYKIYKISE